MNKSKHAILITFYQILVKGNNHYITPRQDTILELLKKYHHINIKRSWGFQCTHDLEADGYVKRRRRWTRDPESGIRSKPSVWTFTMLGAQYLINKGVSGARKLLKQMQNWLQRDDKRFPAAQDLVGTDKRTDKDEALARLQEIYQKIG